MPRNVADEGLEESDGLHRLAEPRLVAQQAAAAVVGGKEPGYTVELMAVQPPVQPQQERVSAFF